MRLKIELRNRFHRTFYLLKKDLCLYYEDNGKLLKDFKEGSDIHSQIRIFHKIHWQGAVSGKTMEAGSTVTVLFPMKRETILQWFWNTEQRSDFKNQCMKQVKLSGLDGWFACGKEGRECRRSVRLAAWVVRCPRTRKCRVGNEMVGADLNLRWLFTPRWKHSRGS